MGKLYITEEIFDKILPVLEFYFFYIYLFNCKQTYLFINFSLASPYLTATSKTSNNLGSIKSAMCNKHLTPKVDVTI